MRCFATGKVILQKRGVRLWMRRHVRGLCARCMSGVYQWSGYPCTKTGKPHQHVGHSVRASERSA